MQFDEQDLKRSLSHLNRCRAALERYEPYWADKRTAHSNDWNHVMELAGRNFAWAMVAFNKVAMQVAPHECAVIARNSVAELQGRFDSMQQLFDSHAEYRIGWRRDVIYNVMGELNSAIYDIKAMHAARPSHTKKLTL